MVSVYSSNHFVLFYIVIVYEQNSFSNFKLSSKPCVNRRATRGAWRHRYDGDKRTSRDQDRPPSVSSSSSDADTRITPSSKPFLAMNDPSVSYKDVLLRFAELTQIEKQPGSPQVRKIFYCFSVFLLFFCHTLPECCVVLPYCS